LIREVVDDQIDDALRHIGLLRDVVARNVTHQRVLDLLEAQVARLEFGGCKLQHCRPKWGGVKFGLPPGHLAAGQYPPGQPCQNVPPSV
jgi:hypothetical protein